MNQLINHLKLSTSSSEEPNGTSSQGVEKIFLYLGFEGQIWYHTFLPFYKPLTM